MVNLLAFFYGPPIGFIAFLIAIPFLIYCFNGCATWKILIALILFFAFAFYSAFAYGSETLQIWTTIMAIITVPAVAIWLFTHKNS